MHLGLHLFVSFVSLGFTSVCELSMVYMRLRESSFEFTCVLADIDPNSEDSVVHVCVLMFTCVCALVYMFLVTTILLDLWWA